MPPAIDLQTPDHQDSVRASAHTTYQQRITELQAAERRLHREHIQLGYLRLSLGIAIVLLLFPPIPPVFVAVAAFAVAARIHQRVLGRLSETRRALAFYVHGLARLEDRWTGLRPRNPRVDRTASLYAEDLDLFGDGSLFELLCEAHTSLGEDTLAHWLLEPAPVAEITDRQGAVKELRERLALREAFAAAPGPALAVIDREALLYWGGMSPFPLPGFLRWLAPLLVALLLLAVWRYSVVHSPLLLICVLVVNGGLTFAFSRIYKSMFVKSEQVSRSLLTMTALLRSVEAETFASPALVRRRAVLLAQAHSSSRALARLTAFNVWAEARHNYLVRILDTPLLYSLQLALALERWRLRFGPQLGPWLETLGEFEALLSLAGYSYEHPADPFPQVTESVAAFMATGLGHPLLPGAACVRNDVSLGHGRHMLLISGSNMSGKSTLLRSVGMNAVLAFAGAPVRAETLLVSPLSIAASIHVSDSLQAGRSRFYAEILRLRAITGAAHARGPVLFLIDEVLAGTNSSDRLAGSRGLVRELLGTGAIGLLSTHDLALTALGDEALSDISNAHFEDAVVDGRLVFDYTLRDGVVERSNGLALMRLIGLNV